MSPILGVARFSGRRSVEELEQRDIDPDEITSEYKDERKLYM